MQMKSIVIALPQPSEEQRQPFRERLKSFFRRYGAAVFFLAVLLSGFVVGAVRSTSGTGQSLSLADRFLLSLPYSMSVRSPAMVFADSFCVSFIFAASLCFLALTPSGIAAIPAVIFFRGFEYGILAGHLCTAYGFKGLAYFVSVVFAGAFLSSLAFVYVSQYCMGCSLYMLLALFGNLVNGNNTLRTMFRELVLNVSYSLILIVLASLTDTLLFILIGRSFSF